MKSWKPERIREFRKELELTQMEFAKKLGVTRGYVTALEKGIKAPSQTLMNLLDCLKREKNLKRKLNKKMKKENER